MQPSEERWLPLVGYEDIYEVSDQGRVRGLDRLVPRGGGTLRRQIGKLLSIHKGDHYSKVRLMRDGDGKTHNVHSLVMAAFVGPCPPGMEVCHNNGQHHDNRLANLRYDTHSANERDAVKHGANFWSKRTHCHAGHEYTPENTTFHPYKPRTRVCRACARDHQRRRYPLKPKEN